MYNGRKKLDFLLLQIAVTVQEAKKHAKYEQKFKLYHTVVQLDQNNLQVFVVCL